MNKPDFHTIADKSPDTPTHDSYLGFIAGCEHVWANHVEPLMKELEAKDKEMDIEIHHLQDEDLKERDKFAIGFARHIVDNAWQDDYREQRTHTVEEHLALYKESLKP